MLFSETIKLLDIGEKKKMKNRICRPKYRYKNGLLWHNSY